MSKKNAVLDCDTINEVVASRFMAIRKAKGLSRAKAAELAGGNMKWDLLRRLEEEGRVVSIEILIRLCNAYELNPSEVISQNFSITV